ncbi:B12-binding domain-containing radical SAM protein [Planctomycetota bacterium]
MTQQKKVKKNVTDICFIVCPDYWAYTPSLAVATLAGVLKYAKYRVKIADINVAFQRRYNIYPDNFSKMMNSMWNPLDTIEIKKKLLCHLLARRPLKSLPDDIKEHNISQQLLFHYNFFREYYLDEVAESSEVLGFTIIADNLLCSLAVINLIKTNHPDKKIVVGGPECHSFNAMEVLKLSPNINMICGSDGEIALLNYLNSINGKTSEESGYLIQVNGSWKDYGERKLTNREFNKFGVMADFSEFPLHLYLVPGLLPLVTSRGCTSKCIFCSERLLYSPYRRISANNLKETLIRIKDEYSPSKIKFADSLLNGSRKIFDEFLKVLKQVNWKIPWEGNMRADNIDDKHFKLLRETNCRKIFCGIETMIPNVLRDMKKEVSLTNATETIKAAHDNGIKVHGYLIVGFPGEKTGDYMKTLPLLFELDSFYTHVITFRYLPSEGQDEIYRKFKLRPSLDFEKFLDRENDPPPINHYILKNYLRSNFFTDKNGYDFYDRTLRQIYSMQLLNMAQHGQRDEHDISMEFIKRYDWLPFRVDKPRHADNRFIFYGREIKSKNKLENDILASMNGKNTIKQIVKELTTEQTDKDGIYTSVYEVFNRLL